MSGVRNSISNLCLICLRADRKLKTIAAVLTEYHDDITDFAIGSTHPKYCSECEHLLLKTYKFHQKCKRAAAILAKWRKMKVKNKTPIEQLHLELPVTGLDWWSPENNRVFTYNCTDVPDQITVKKEVTEDPVHSEMLFKQELLCEDNKIIGVSEALLQLSNDEFEDTKNVFQNQLINDNTINTGRINNSQLSIYRIAPKTSVGSVADLNNTKISEHEYGNVIVKLEEDTSSSSDITSKLAHNMIKLHNVSTNNKPTVIIDGGLVSSNIIVRKPNEFNETDQGLICFGDDRRDKVIEIDDEVKYASDASLNSDDDCDDYLSLLKERTCRKRTLDPIDNIMLNKQGIVRQYDAKQKKNTCVKDDDHLPELRIVNSEENMFRRLENMNNTLNDICENWEVTCLEHLNENITIDQVKELTRKRITEKIDEKITATRMKNLPKNSNLERISHDLSIINANCSRVVENYKSRFQDSKERFEECDGGSQATLTHSGTSVGSPAIPPSPAMLTDGQLPEEDSGSECECDEEDSDEDFADFLDFIDFVDFVDFVGQI